MVSGCSNSSGTRNSVSSGTRNFVLYIIKNTLVHIKNSLAFGGFAPEFFYVYIYIRVCNYSWASQIIVSKYKTLYLFYNKELNKVINF